jgi:hypothetical protein
MLPRLDEPSTHHTGALRASSEAMRRLKKALILVAYLAGVFVLFEGVARLALSSDAFFARIAVQDDSSWRLRWIRRHAQQGEILYQFDLYDPIRGWAVKPRVRGGVAFPGKVLNSNSKGLRGEREHDYEKRPGVVRILLLGDSFTFGDEVSDDETYAARLQELLPEAEIVNLGVHGYGHDQMLIYFEQEGVKYHADLVILGFVSIDMPRNLLEFRDFAKPRFTLLDGHLTLQNTPVPTPEMVLGAEFRRSKLLDLLEIARQSLRWKSAANERQAETITTAILDRLASQVKAAGGVPVFVYLPMPEDMPPAGAERNARERYLADLCQTRGIGFFSVRPAFADTPAKMRSMFLDYHWSPEGHRRAAQGIREGLRVSGLLGG